MHTSTFKSCRIHHNGDISDGYFFITNKDSTSKAIGKKAEIKYQSLAALKKLNLENKKTITLVGLKDVNSYSNSYSEFDDKITVLVKDIQCFIAADYIDKIKDKLWDSDNKVVLKIAKLLGIK